MTTPRIILNLGMFFVVGLAPALLADTASKEEDTASLQASSPVNQVFQFAYTGTCTSWSDGKPTTATAYLWIPENCQHLRGLLILGYNVPEHRLVGHKAIRQVCIDNDLGIVWCTPSFFNNKPPEPGKSTRTNQWDTCVAFLQQLLDGLASVSGYDEVASVPWLPLGESGHLKMVHALLDEKPDRCIAGILLKNQNLPPHNRVTPVLTTDGTAYEWTQDKTDIRTQWNNCDKLYSRILTARQQNPQWPLSYVIDGNSGHFDCSDRFVNYVAYYIDVITKARLPDKPGDPLKPLDMSKGFSADLPVPGHENQPIQPGSPDLAVPWYPDRQLAEKAQGYAAINWKAETQFINFLDDKGNPLPHDFNGITNIKSVTFEDDGITFTIHCQVADKIPSDFVDAGEPLAQTSGTPNVEWLCGPLEPLGGNRFRIALDRTWLGRGASYLGARQAGNDQVRGILEPTGVNLTALKNTDGKVQKITFPAIANVAVGTGPIPLSATSDAGLPVSYFVVEGPAVIQGDKLVLTPIPPRTKFPMNVKVAAWQWGKKGEVQTADIVQQSFQITR